MRVSTNRSQTPISTRRGAASGANLIRTETAREWIGTDASADSQIVQMLATAQEEVAARLGIRIDPAPVVETYAAWIPGGRLISSMRYAADPAVSVIDIFGLEADIPTSAYTVDRTGSRTAIIPRELVSISTTIHAPVSVSFMTGLDDSPELTERVTNAILTLTGIYFEARGTTLPRNTERTLDSLLPRRFS